MMLYGRKWSRREIEARVGRIEQLGGLRRCRLAGGPEDSVEAVEVRTGAGLSYTVLPSRGLDISLCEFAGAPLSWQSPCGEPHPAYYDPRGLEWLRTAVGGLLMTCGLTQVGSPCRDASGGGEELGLHGRAHHVAARQVAAEGAWRRDEYEMRVSGVVEESRIFGESLVLRRTIRSRLGANTISIEDVVENVGFQKTPLMILYHFNFGWPLVAEGTSIGFPSRRVTPRDEGTPLDGCDVWQRPAAGYRERVYYHEKLATDRRGWASATIRNGRFPLPGSRGEPLAVRLSWNAKALPMCVEWKMPGEREHVLGIEPSNCRVEGREKERQSGTLVELAPGRSAKFELELEVAAG